MDENTIIEYQLGTDIITVGFDTPEQWNGFNSFIKTVGTDIDPSQHVQFFKVLLRAYRAGWRSAEKEVGSGSCLR